MTGPRGGTWVALLLLVACAGGNGGPPGDAAPFDLSGTGDTSDAFDEAEGAGPPESIDAAPVCLDWSDCPPPMVCRGGLCVEPVLPRLRDLAMERVSADPPGRNVLVGGRLLQPAGRTSRVGTLPTTLAVHPGGAFLAVNENGFGTVLDPSRWTDKAHVLRLVATEDLSVVHEAVMPDHSMYIGLRFSGDGGHLWVAGGRDGQVHEYAVLDGPALEYERSLPVEGCYTADVLPSADGARLYVSCDVEGDVVALDALDGAEVARALRGGARAYRLALTAGGGVLWVAEWTSTTRPANGDTVTAYDAHDLGLLARVNVGLGPEDLVPSADGERLYVIDNRSDDVHVLDALAMKVQAVWSLGDPAFEPGAAGPTSGVLTPDGEALLVTAAGANAVAWIETATGTVRGWIPTGWWPTDLALGVDGRQLFVLNGKGSGDGPTAYLGEGGLSEDRGQVGRQLLGSVQALDLPDPETLAAQTEVVQQNNDRQALYFDWAPGDDGPIPAPGDPRASPIRHVFLVMKENFSYDAAYGAFESGEGRPDYQLWSEDALPNQWKLAREYTLFDNFYCDGESSIQGHQWAAAGLETDFVAKGWALNYGGFGLPEIVNSVTAGSVAAPQLFLPHLIETSVSVYSWGGLDHFGVEGFTRYRDNNDALYPLALNQAVLDRDRAERFVSAFEERVAAGTVPSVSWILLPNNHAFGVTVGEPTPETWVADNDEAVGRVVEAIAASTVWRDSLIILFEDDSQHGFDHVDQHRCPALFIGPWVRRGHVSSAAYSIPNLLRTVEAIVGVGPMHAGDGRVVPMLDAFVARPDETPFVREPRRYPDEIYLGPEDELTRASGTLDWGDIDRNPEAAELYHRYVQQRRAWATR